MGGVRNGRALRLVLATAVAVVFALYVVYLYHSAKGELEEAHNRLEAINKIHERLTKELKDSLQNHAQLASELKEERTSHFKTVSEKDNIQEKCTQDVKKLKETCANEKSLLTDQNNSLMDERDRLIAERDDFKGQAISMQTSLTDLRNRHTTLTTQCNEQSETARKSLKQCQARVKQVEGDLASARASLHDTQLRWQQCNDGLERNKQKVSLMDTDSHYKQSQIDKLEQQVRSMQSQISSLQNELRLRPPEGQKQFQGERSEPQAPAQATKYGLHQPDRNTADGGYGVKQDHNVGQSHVLRREAVSDRPAGADDIKITDEQKEKLFHNLQEKVNRGELLTPKQSRLYQLLLNLREVENTQDHLRTDRDQGVEHHGPQGQVPPDTDERTPQPFTAQPSFVDAGNKLSQQPPDTGNRIGQQHGGFGMGQQPAGNGVGQQPAGFGMGQQPAGNGMGQQPGGFGMGQQPTGNGVGQQPGGNGVGQQPGGIGMGQQPGGIGMGQQPAGNGAGQEPSRMVPSPAHSDPQQPRDEQEEIKDIADPGKEGGPQLQFENLGEDKQQKLKKEESEEEMEAFDPAEIAKQAKKYTSEGQEGENGRPLPQPINKNQNPDKEFDDYNKGDDGDEDGQYGREYEEEDRYGDHQLKKDREEEQRILRRKNAEGQLQQPALSEQDGHRKQDDQKQRLNEMR